MKKNINNGIEKTAEERICKFLINEEERILNKIGEKEIIYDLKKTDDKLILDFNNEKDYYKVLDILKKEKKYNKIYNKNVISIYSDIDVFKNKLNMIIKRDPINKQLMLDIIYIIKLEKEITLAFKIDYITYHKRYGLLNTFFILNQENRNGKNTYWYVVNINKNYLNNISRFDSIRNILNKENYIHKFFINLSEEILEHKNYYLSLNKIEDFFEEIEKMCLNYDDSI